MTASGMANSAPLWSNAVWTDAAIGTLAAVATRNSSRTVRELPGTAFADQVNCVHGSHSIRKMQRRLADGVPRRARQQEPDDLGEGEDEGEVEEQLDRVGGKVLGRFWHHEATHAPRVARSVGGPCQPNTTTPTTPTSTSALAAYSARLCCSCSTHAEMANAMTIST